MSNTVKKISVAIVLALFYTANVVYERAHTPGLSMAVLPQPSVLSQTNMQNIQAQNSGSSDPPQQPQILAHAAQSPSVSRRGSAAASPPKQAASSGQISAASASNSASAVVVAPPPPGHAAPPPPVASAPPPAQAAQSQGQYKNGSYTGSSADALFGTVQVQVTVSNGQISNVQFLSYPNDNSTSLQKSNHATPILAQEAIAAQSASVQIVSGATETSQAFIQSLTSALNQAKA
jgi:uncharacterized protein with FMN-binding domain